MTVCMKDVVVSYEDLENNAYWPEDLCQAVYYKTDRHLVGIRCVMKAWHYPTIDHQTAEGLTWRDKPAKPPHIAVIASSLHAGNVYIQELGLKDCEVYVDERHLKGKQIKGVIITPGYFYDMLQRIGYHVALVDSAVASSSGLSTPNG